MKSWQQLLLILENSSCLFNVFPATKYAHASIGESRKHCDSSIHAIHLYIHVSLIDGWVLNHQWNWVFMYLCIYVFYIFHVQTRITQKHKILLATESTYTHSQICELTRIEWVSPSFRDSHLHENLSFTSPALPIFNLLPPPSHKKKKKEKKKKQKQSFI